MKKTLLLLFMAFSMSLFSQGFGTGSIQLSSNFSMELDISSVSNMTTLTLVGPSNVWLAVGFGGSSMTPGIDVFRTNGTSVEDARVTGFSFPPNDSQQDWSLVSNNVTGGTRTMVVRRANNTGDSNDFIFTPQASNISIIWAVGPSSNTSSRHATRGATAISTLSISEARKLDFTMYPNPVLDEVNVQLPTGTSSAKVSVFDYSGRLILTKNINSFDSKLNTRNLSTGIYLMKVETDNKLGAQKLIKR